jgi:O-antigen/teichoic acid export membrane protein
LLVNTGWSALATFFSAATIFASNIIVARVLGPKELGEFAYAIWLIMTTWAVVNLGLSNSLTRYVAELTKGTNLSVLNATARWFVVRLCGIAIASGMVVSLSGGLLSTAKGDTYYYLVGFLLTVYGTGQITVNWLSGLQRFDILARLRLMLGAGQLVCVTLGSILYGLTGALFGFVFPQAILVLVGIWALCAGDLHTVDRRNLPLNLAPRVRGYAFSVWLNAIVSIFVWQRAEIFFLDMYHGPYEVAMFAVGLSLVALTAKIPDMFTSALMPYFAGESGSTIHQNLASVFSRFTLYTAVILFPLSLIGAVLAPQIIRLLFGEEYGAAATTASVLLLAAPFRGFALVQQSALYGLEKARFMGLNGLCGAVLAIVAALTFIPSGGAFGASLGRFLVQLTVTGAAGVYLASHLGLGVPYGRLLRALMAAGLVCLTVWSLSDWTETWAGLAATCFLAGTVYVFSLGVFHVLQPDDRDLIEHFIDGLPRPLAALARPVFSAIVGSSSKRA